MNLRLAKTYRRRRFTALFVVLIIVLFFLLQKGLLKGLNSFFARLVTPVWQAENFLGDYLAFSLESKKELWKQNTLLKESLEEKDLELRHVKSLEEENRELKEILGRVDQDSTVVLASILAKPNQTPYDTLVIDRGSDEGLSPEALVFADGDILIGEVESVEASSARVLMYSTPGNISQVILGSTGRYFNARGLGNGSFEVEVAREIDVKEGDLFFYPGLDQTLMGVAKKVEFDPRDSFKRVIMKSPVNIQEERWVEVRI